MAPSGAGTAAAAGAVAPASAGSGGSADVSVTVDPGSPSRPNGSFTPAVAACAVAAPPGAPDAAAAATGLFSGVPVANAWAALPLGAAGAATAAEAPRTGGCGTGGVTIQGLGRAAAGSGPEVAPPPALAAPFRSRSALAAAGAAPACCAAGTPSYSCTSA